MSLPHALLGLIQYQPATGYDLKITFQKSIHFFWNAALPHIYRTLKQMEREGWIVSTFEHQEGKPNRKVYRITEKGRKELFRWLDEPPETPEPRYPMLVKVFFGNQLPPERFKNHLKSWRQYYSDLLKKYETEVMPVIQRQSTKAGFSEDSIYWNLSLDFGRRQARMVIEWCDQALERPGGKKRKKDRRREKTTNPVNPVKKT